MGTMQDAGVAVEFDDRTLSHPQGPIVTDAEGAPVRATGGTHRLAASAGR